MNKLLTTALVIIGCASITHAAAISWRGNSTAFTVDGKAANGNAIVLVMNTKDAAAPIISWKDGNLSVGAGTYLGKSALGSDGKKTTDAISITGNWTTGTISVFGGSAYGYPGTVDTTGFGNKNGRDYYMVVFDSATIDENSKYTMVSLANKYPGSETGTLTLSFGGADLGSTADWESVPEPTSLALIALGVAAFGLKRKHA